MSHHQSLLLLWFLVCCCCCCCCCCSCCCCCCCCCCLFPFSIFRNIMIDADGHNVSIEWVMGARRLHNGLVWQNGSMIGHMIGHMNGCLAPLAAAWCRMNGHMIGHMNACPIYTHIGAPCAIGCRTRSTSVAPPAGFSESAPERLLSGDLRPMHAQISLPSNAGCSKLPACRRLRSRHQDAQPSLPISSHGLPSP